MGTKAQQSGRLPSHYWVELPRGIDQRPRPAAGVFQTSRVNGGFGRGGLSPDRDGQGKNCMRMSFGNTPEDLIEEGVRRLGGLICSS